MDELTTSKVMTKEEELASAKDFRDISFSNVQDASRRGSELSDEFNRLEVQVAALLFAFAGLFIGNFSSFNPQVFSSLGILMMRLTFAASIFFLIASLLAGLLHIKRKEKFWDEMMSQKNARFIEWNKVAVKQISFKEGDAFHRGTAFGHGPIARSPVWTWVLQTIFLGIAITLLFILSLVFLFQ